MGWNTTIFTKSVLRRLTGRTGTEEREREQNRRPIASEPEAEKPTPAPSDPDGAVPEDRSR